MTTQRRSYQTGHRPKCLVIVDETAEWDRAVYYASRWAIRAGGGVVMLRVIETEGQNQQWLGVADIMRAEAHEDANAALDRAAGRANGIAAITPERAIREGDPTEQILDVIDKDVDIAKLVLAANPGPEGPGPMITMMADAAGSFPIPVTIVPGDLSDDDIDALIVGERQLATSAVLSLPLPRLLRGGGWGGGAAGTADAACPHPRPPPQARKRERSIARGDMIRTAETQYYDRGSAGERQARTLIVRSPSPSAKGTPRAGLEPATPGETHVHSDRSHPQSRHPEIHSRPHGARRRHPGICRSRASVPLAARGTLFDVAGVTSVFYGGDFVTVTKDEQRLAAPQARHPRRRHGALYVRVRHCWPTAAWPATRRPTRTTNSSTRPTPRPLPPSRT